MSAYYTDREYGARPRSIDAIDERLWAGLVGLIGMRLGDGSFGWRFPEQCSDGMGACDCGAQAFGECSRQRCPGPNGPSR